jgi:hypothetical protein
MEQGEFVYSKRAQNTHVITLSAIGWRQRRSRSLSELQEMEKVNLPRPADKKVVQ